MVVAIEITIGLPEDYLALLYPLVQHANFQYYAMPSCDSLGAIAQHALEGEVDVRGVDSGGGVGDSSGVDEDKHHVT